MNLLRVECKTAVTIAKYAGCYDSFTSNTCKYASEIKGGS